MKRMHGRPTTAEAAVSHRQITLRSQIRLWAFPLVFLLAWGLNPSRAIALDGAKAQSLPVEEIVTRLLDSNARRAEALREYRSIRNYDVTYRGFPTGYKHAHMVVNVSYHAPHQKAFTIVSEEGSKLLLNRVLHKLLQTELEATDRKEHLESDLSRDNYRFELIGEEQKDNRDCYVLKVNPLRKSRLVYDGQIWVDMRDFAVVHIEAQPAKSPSFWIKQTHIEHQYQQVGDFWLPLRNRSTSRVRFGGSALLSIEYSQYELGPEQKTDAVSHVQSLTNNGINSTKVH